MRLREWFLNKRSVRGGTGPITRPRSKANVAVERLEGRELLSVGVHIPPMGLSGPGMSHVSHTPVTPHGSTSGITIPPLGISRPVTSHSSTGMTLTSGSSGMSHGFHLVGSSSPFMGNGMIGGMMGGGMMM
jgi:hypothetical protein